MMKHLASTLLIASIVASSAKCSPAPPTAPPPPTAASGPTAAGTERKTSQGTARGDTACEGANSQERLTIPAGGAATARSGMTIRFAGAQHDHYDDGRTELLLGLELSAGGGPTSTWMPSAFAAPAYHAFGDHCVRIVDAAEARVVIDIAPLPAAPSSNELPDCRLSCCSPEQHVPGPDGAIECCFCNEKKP